MRLRILIETLSALTYLHRLSPLVLHRDVKPSNILLDGACRAWLADTGMAKAAAESQQLVSKLTTTTVRGTPGFVDPLITNGLQHSPLTDGFAMGITILMALVALPAVGLKAKCRLMLRHPHAPERWQPPCVPDASAGEWPTRVVSCVLETVGYTYCRLHLGNTLVILTVGCTQVSLHSGFVALRWRR